MLSEHPIDITTVLWTVATSVMNLDYRNEMIILESLLTTSEASIIIEAVGAVTK